VDTPWAEIEADVQPFVELAPVQRGERFAAFLRSECGLVATPAEPTSIVKFGLLADLGIITVPADWVNQSEFAGMEFPTPTRVLKPGDRLWVRAHKQIGGGTTTSEERLAYLASLNSHLTGAPGVRLVRGDKAWAKVPKGYYWFASFDEKERLPIDAERSHRVPVVGTDWGGGRFDLGGFGRVWDGRNAFLSFCDVPLGA
jgi:hypothetical protein